MKVIVQHKKDPTLKVVYSGVKRIAKHEFDDTGKLWVLILESREASDPTPEATATFHACEWEIYTEHTW